MHTESVERRIQYVKECSPLYLKSTMTQKIGPLESEKEIYKRKIQELEELEQGNKMDTRKKKNTECLSFLKIIIK